MKVRKIGLLLSHAGIGGGERVVLDLLRVLDRKLFSPSVILPDRGPLTEQLAQINVPFEVVPFRRDCFLGYPPAWNPRATKKIREILIENDTSLLHINDSYLSLLGGEAARGLNIPVALTAHGLWDAHFFWQRHLNKKFFQRIWAPTDRVSDAIKAGGSLDNERVRVIPFGVDTNFYSPIDRKEARRSLGINLDEFVVLRIGRFDVVKDYPTLLNAHNQLLRDGKTIRLMIVGDQTLNIFSESDQVKRKILSLIQETQRAGGKVEAAGFQLDVRPYIAACDVLVSSSTSESFGLNILEAMSMEKPVISTRTDGPSEIMRHEETGLFVPVRNPTALARAIEKLKSNESLRRELGRNARLRVVNSYSLNRFVQAMADQYLELARP